ncbi:hypothetical protein BC827DRAFT_1240812 [Russula dissimulans]|nr:hypothetical protein BC827DRAFT_1240812 [Russula dissimulans]
MTHSSPQAYLVWSALSCLVTTFLVYHLWSFDRFRCLRWNQGFDGGFKRLMTYTYITGLPLVLSYSIGFCVIKYSEGYIYIPEVGVVPKPFHLWTKSHQRASFPLFLCISIAWGLEMVTHLESLCFLVFLINSASPHNWFRSWYFKTWATGSLISVIYLPLITILTRSDPLKCEAFTFLAGSTGSLLLTVCSMIVMSAFFLNFMSPRTYSRFPHHRLRFKPFLEGLRREGVDISVVVRLTKFYELTMIYIFSRALFAIPLLLLSADGVRSHHHINESLFLADLLQVTSGFGVAITAAIALPIFFPRSIEGEIARADSHRRKNYSSNKGMSHVSQNWEAGIHDMYDLDQQSGVDSEAGKSKIISNGISLHHVPPREGVIGYIVADVTTTQIRLEPNRRLSPPAAIGHRQAPSISMAHLQAGYAIAGTQSSDMSQLVKTFKSPFDIGMS